MTDILAKTSNNGTPDRYGTSGVRSIDTLRLSILAFVLRTGIGGMFAAFLRSCPGQPRVETPARSGPSSCSRALTLGKATVCLYVILLLAAVISARVLPRGDDSQPRACCDEITENLSPENNSLTSR
jgi:hypothetical protein